ENEWDALDRFEQDETQGGRRRDNRFGYDTDSSSGFHVAHDSADEAWGVRQARSDARLPTPGDDCVVQTDSFPACKDHEWLPRQRRPRHGAAFGERMAGGHDDAEPFFPQQN